MPLTFKEFAEANHTRCTSPEGFGQEKLTDWDTAMWFSAMAGEWGEANEALLASAVTAKLNRMGDTVKKISRDELGYAGNKQTADELRAQLRKELGDVGVYLDLMCQACGFTLEEAMVEVFNAKSAQIGYPVQLTN